MPEQILEGTWEELTRHAADFAGKILRLEVIGETANAANGQARNWEKQNPEEEERPFYETATPEAWAREFRQWAESHDRTAPPLPPEAVSRESIYEGRG